MSNTNEVPIPSGYDVYWEPWIDAYDTEEVNSLKKIFEDNYLDPEASEEEEILFREAADEELDEVPFFTQPIKTIMTPFGVLPLTEQTLASTYFKFWVGHSNFKLLEDFYSLIEECKGVESIDILTPYRFRIAVGKLFRDRDVMYEVRKTLLGVVKQNEPKE